MAESAFFRANRDLSALFSSPQPVARDLNPVLPVSGGAASTPDACRKRAREHSEVKFRETLNEENAGYLQRIVALGTRHQIIIHFLNTPKADCYRAGYSESTRQAGPKRDPESPGCAPRRLPRLFRERRVLIGGPPGLRPLSLEGARKAMRDLAARPQTRAKGTE